MPRFQDPSICTPERCRAVSALHWFGVVQLLFAVGFTVFHTVTLMVDKYDSGVIWVNPHSLLVDFRAILFVTFFPAAMGVLAVAAAVGVCRCRWWGLELGSRAIVIFLFPLSLAGIVVSVDFWRSLFSSAPLSLAYCLFAVYVCVSFAFAMLASRRCNRLHVQERSSPCRAASTSTTPPSATADREKA